KLYYVRVRAVNSTTSNDGAWSVTLPVTTTIAVPELQDASDIQTNSFRVNWKPVTSVGTYQLDVAEDTVFSKILPNYNNKSILPPNTNQKVDGLTKNTKYFYRMRAVKGTFTTANSEIKVVRTNDELGFQISTSSNPAIGGTTSGGGTYNSGQSVTVTATKATGYNFVNWTEGGIQVSTNASYVFIASSNRTLVANFTPVYTISTSSSPSNGGTTNGGGNYNSGQNVTVTATPNTNFDFVNWTEGGTQFSTNASYTFVANGNRTLVANFTAKSSFPPPVLTQPFERTQNGFKISWSKVPGATEYRYDLALDIAFSQTLTGYVNEDTPDTSLEVVEREPNTTFFFRVKGVTNTKDGEYAVSGAIKTLPNPPGVPTVSVPTEESPISFIAHWQAPATGGAVDLYLLDVSTDQNFAAGKWILQNDTVTVTQKLVSALTPSTEYYYRVRANNEGGESGNSGTQKATTTSGIPDVPVLSPATSVSATGFTINWTGPVNAESYQLDVGTNNPITVFVEGYQNKTVTGTSEPLTGLTSGMTFHYQVRAVNSYGTSVSSSVGTTLLIPGPPTASLPTNETSTSFTANWQAATGASGYFLDVSQSDLFTSFESGYENRSVSGTSETVPGLTTNRAYHYRVRAANASGISGNSNVVSLTLLPLAPAFSGLVINPATAVLGTSDVEIKITIANSPVGVFLFYGSPTATVLTQTTMTLSGGQYVATINKSSYGKEGLVFKISSENERGKTWYPAENQVTSIPVNIPAQNIISEVIPTSSFPAGIEKQTWNTLSLPFTGSVNLTTILGNQELTGGEPVNWAAYTFNGEFGSTTTLTGGQAVFLYHKSGDGANLIKNTVNAAGVIVTYDQNAFGNTLLANGWNLVAWPYTYGAQISIKDGTKVGSVWQMKAGSWEKNSSVKPFGGYAIYNKTGTGGLKVSDVLSWTTQSLSKVNGSDLAQYDADWLVKLGVSSKTTSDAWNYIGVSMKASAGLDLLDEKNPVSPGSDLDLFVSEEDGQQPVALAASIKNAGKGLKIWNLKVKNSSSGNQVKLNWEHLNVPEEINLVLVDLTAKRTVDLQKSRTGVIALSSGSESNLQILAGSTDEIESAIQELKSELRASFILFPNYPNPFNPTTLVSFEMGREEVLELAIYNSIGQKIKTLYSGIALAGKQQIEWNGKDDAGNPVSSGVYFCTMKAGTFVKTNKMLLTR
ncbi:MAG: fibronectin type III domain-containing protein, partial [Bacteroidetes bacterium]|nr:fibronectin type III domain-containing protein [Bacteroidota bacterium]